MKIKQVEENGNTVLIEGTLNDLTVTTRDTDGNLISQFEGSMEEFTELQSIVHRDEEEEDTLDEDEVSFEAGDKVELLNSKETDVYERGDILTVVDTNIKTYKATSVEVKQDGETSQLISKKNLRFISRKFKVGDTVEVVDDSYNNDFKNGDIAEVVAASDEMVTISCGIRQQIMATCRVRKLSNKYKKVNEKGAMLSVFKKGTIVKIISDNTPNIEDSLGNKQRLPDDCLDDITLKDVFFELAGKCNFVLNVYEGFKGVTLFHKEDGKVTIDDSLMGVYLWSSYNNYNPEELSPYRKELDKKEFKLEKGTLYYLKETITDDYGDSVDEGFVIYGEGFGDVKLLVQADKNVFIIPEDLDVSKVMFKVKRYDIVKVIDNKTSENNVLGKVGFLFQRNEGIFKLVKGKEIPASFVLPHETEPVSDKKAQKFFDKEIGRITEGREEFNYGL